MLRIIGAAGVLAALLAWAPTGVYAQQPPVAVPTPGGDITVIADRLEHLGADNLLIGTGNVEITRGAARLTADRVEINRATGDSVAQGRVIFYDGEDRISAERIDYNFRTGTGVVHDGQARTAPYYRLSGERLERIGDSVYRIRRGVFTTCEADPPAWSFHVGEATADLNSYVYGTNASFWIRNVPVIPWIPFFAAAIRRERQTGFLFPKFGQSSSKGFGAEIPFFWAISDSQDATIAPLAYERRGFGLNADYRYVLSAENAGSLKGFYVREAAKADDDRGWIGGRHDWNITPELTLKADVRSVTDDDVFKDYGDPLKQRSEQRVDSNIFLSRRWTSWNLVGNAFWYQDLTTRRPVELHRLPEITLTGVRQPVPGAGGLLWELSGSTTRFVRDVGSDGTRIDANPRLSRPISPDGLFTVTPFVGGRATAYDRRVTGLHTSPDGIVTEETRDEFRMRRILEAGADLESIASRLYRPGRWGFDALLHTVEPRVNYTWADAQDADRLPNFTDLDRVDDQSRVEYSLTNRIRGRSKAPAGTEPVKLEVLRLMLGHSIDVKSDERRSGDAVGDLIVQPSQTVRFRGTVRHDTHGEGVRVATTDVSAQIARVGTSVGWRYSETQDVSFLQGAATADITPNLVGRVSTNWDIRDNRFIENRYAMDFRFQCYALTVEYVSRSREGGRGGENEIRFAVNLLGVGGPIGSSLGLGSLTSGGGTSSR
ncbi:MAG: LPS-assembly protein LptD [Candidatus Rokubacteria bacterium]|nr:LPS-assembly protein LptD [Candidatus Rokubacteria bacterium]